MRETCELIKAVDEEYEPTYDDEIQKENKKIKNNRDFRRISIHNENVIKEKRIPKQKTLDKKNKN